MNHNTMPAQQVLIEESGLDYQPDSTARVNELTKASQEQERTIQFQKAKIAALQTELEEALSQLAERKADE